MKQQLANSGREQVATRAAWRLAGAALYGFSVLTGMAVPLAAVQAQATPTCAAGYYWTGTQCDLMPTAPTPTPAPALSACALPVGAPVAWGAACSAIQNGGAPLNPGHTFTLQNVTPGYLGSITRICGLNGALSTLAAPCTTAGSFVPQLLQSNTGDWTLGFIGQVKPITLTINSTGGCGASSNYNGTATVNRDGSITVAVPPYSGFGNCTAPRPYLQNTASCTLGSPSYGQSVFTFAPGFVVSSVPAENSRGGGCR